MAYHTGRAVCPRCGSSEQVRTVRKLFDMLNGTREQAFQRANQMGWRPGSGPGFRGAPDDGGYDHYNVEGSDTRRGPAGPAGRRSVNYDYDSGAMGDDIGGDIAGAAISAALGFAGRSFGRRMKRALEEKVVPAIQAKAAHAQQQWEQSKADQDEIVARYPGLRGCLRDNVVFLDGGQRAVPISDIKMPVTLAQADEVVARLRGYRWT